MSLPGVYRGQVVRVRSVVRKREHPVRAVQRHLVQLRIPSVFGDRVTGWAEPIQRGFRPQVKDVVWVAFENGDHNEPRYWLGSQVLSGDASNPAVWLHPELPSGWYSPDDATGTIRGTVDGTDRFEIDELGDTRSLFNHDIVGNLTVGGTLDVTGAKNSRVVSGELAYRFAADESASAGRLISDFRIEIFEKTSSLPLPPYLFEISQDPWTRGPWPQGHAGRAYAVLSDTEISLHGDPGLYAVEVVSYRNDPGVAGWTHEEPM